MTDNTDTILQVRHLTKFYTKKGMFSSKSTTVKAVDDVTFSLKKGQVFVLAGESGSGKSTIAKLILKSIQADSGEIIFENQVINDDKKSLERIRMNCQMIHQDPYDSINPRMKVEQIVSEPLEIHNIGDKKERQKRVIKGTTGGKARAGRGHCKEISTHVVREGRGRGWFWQGRWH